MTEEQEDLIKALYEVCTALGWEIMVPKSTDEDDDTVDGLIIGTPEFIDEIMPLEVDKNSLN